MSDFYNGTTSSIHSMFDQELAEFLRKPYEAYLKRTAIVPTPDERERYTKKAIQATEKTNAPPEGILLKLSFEPPVQPPARRKIRA